MAISRGTLYGGELLNADPQTLQAGLTLTGGGNSCLIVTIHPNNSLSMGDQVTGVMWGGAALTRKMDLQRSTTEGQFYADAYVYILQGYPGGTEDLTLDAANSYGRTGMWSAIEYLDIDQATVMTSNDASGEWNNNETPSVSVTLDAGGVIYSVFESQRAINAAATVVAPNALIGKIDGTTNAPTGEQGLIVGERAEGSAGTYSVDYATPPGSGDDALIVAFALHEAVSGGPSISAASAPSLLTNVRTAGTTTIPINSITVSGSFTETIVKVVTDNAGPGTIPDPGDAGWQASLTSVDTTLRGPVDLHFWARDGAVYSTAFGPVSVLIDILAFYRILDAVSSPATVLRTIDVETEPGFDPDNPAITLSGLSPAQSYLIQVEGVSSANVPGPRSDAITLVIGDLDPPVTAGPPSALQQASDLVVAIPQGEDPSGVAEIQLEYRLQAGFGSWVVAQTALAPTPSDPNELESPTIYRPTLVSIGAVEGNTVEWRYLLRDNAPTKNASAYETQIAPTEILGTPQILTATLIGETTIRVGYTP